MVTRAQPVLHARPVARRVTQELPSNPSLILRFAGVNTLDDAKWFGPTPDFTRASTATYFDASGVLQTAASGEARFDYDPATGDALGLLVEPQRTNKCANYNASPTDTTTVSKGGDAAATLTVVDDSTELENAGIDIGNGNVLKLDNSGGTSNAFIDIDGQTGNTNDHAMQSWLRGSGTGNLRTVFSDPSNSAFTLTSSYEKYNSDQSSLTAGGQDSTDRMRVSIDAGGVVYIHLNQLEEGSFATSPISVAGSAVTRAADVVEPVSLASLGYSGGPCTMVVRHAVRAVLNPPYIIRLEDSVGNTPQNLVSLRIQGGVENDLLVREAGTFITNTGEIISDDGNEHTIAFAISAAGVTVYEDGVEVYSDTTDYSTVLANVTDLRIGFNVDGTYSEVTFYSSALPASELARVTE